MVGGLIPLKVMGPPAMMVMVPVATRVLSATDVATMVRFAGEFLFVESAGVILVGTDAGAVCIWPRWSVGSGCNRAAGRAASRVSWGSGMVVETCLCEQPGHAFALKIVRERNVELLWFVGGNRGRKGVEDHEHTGVEGKRHGAGFCWC